MEIARSAAGLERDPSPAVEVVQLVIVPGTLVGVLFLAALIPGRLARPEARLSAWTGFWAGLLAVAVYILVVSDSIASPVLSVDGTGRFSWLAALAGLVTGFLLLFLRVTEGKPPGVGLTTMLLSAGAATGLVILVFHPSLRDHLVAFTLCAPLGALIHFALYPDISKNFARPPVMFLD
jgi:hypothetical protein